MKTILFSAINIGAMLVLSSCNKVSNEPATTTQAEKYEEQVLLNADMKFKYEEKVKVYDQYKKNSLTYLVKSNSKLAVDNVIESLKASKIEIIDPPKMLSTEHVHTNNSLEPVQPKVNPNNFVMIKIVEQSYEKGKAVKLSVNLNSKAIADPAATEANRVDETVTGYSVVGFNYYASLHQILNYPTTPLTHFIDYKMVSGSPVYLEDFYLGYFANHWPHSNGGIYEDRLIVASRPNQSIAFDITFY